MHPIITQIGQNSRDEPRPKRIPSQIHNAQVFIDVEISTHHCPFQKYPARQNLIHSSLLAIRWQYSLLFHKHDDPVGYGHKSIIESDASFSLELEDDVLEHYHCKEVGKSLN